MRIRNSLYRILFLAVITLTAAGCGKEGTGKKTLQGHVYERGPGTGKSGVHVKAEATRPGFLGSSAYLLGEAVTDENGYYKLKFNPGPEDTAFNITLSAEKCITIEDRIESTGDLLTKNYTICPEAFISLHIKNVNPGNSQDNFFYNVETPFMKQYYWVYFPEIQKCDPESPTGFYGPRVNTVCHIRVPGNTDTKISWFASKNGQGNGDSFTVYCPAGTTVEQEILY